MVDIYKYIFGCDIINALFCIRYQMEKISEIAKIVTEYRFNKLETLYTGFELADNRYSQVAKALAVDQIKTEDELASMINAPLKSDKFRTFKKRLRNKLLNNLLFLDLNEDNARPYIRAIKTCDRNCYCIDILLLFSASHAGMNLAESTLKTAQEFELFDIALFCAKALRKQH